jgi:hypothetical protein
MFEWIRGRYEMNDTPAKDLGNRIADYLLKYAEGQAGKETHWAARFSVAASLLSLALSIIIGVYTIWISHEQELYKLSSELKDMTVELAKAEDIHSYGGNTNILAKQAAIAADRLRNSWFPRYSASSPEYSVIADALFDTDDQQNALKFAQLARDEAKTSLDKSLAYRTLGAVELGSNMREAGKKDYARSLEVFSKEYNEDPKEPWVLADNARTRTDLISNALTLADCNIAVESWSSLKQLHEHLT